MIKAMPKTASYTGPRLQSAKSGLMIGASLQQARREDQPGIRKAHQAPSIRKQALFLRPHSIHYGGGARGNPRVRRSLSAGFDLPLRPPPHPSEDQLTVAASKITERSYP